MLRKVKCSLLHYKKHTQTIDPSHAFDRRILQMQLNTFNIITKTWNEETIRDLEQVGRKQTHDFVFRLL